MRVRLLHRGISFRSVVTDSGNRIVEYATREQAQNAVNSLSNQNLMGRLVYVREVRRYHTFGEIEDGRARTDCFQLQDREAEPRFIGGPPRGDFGGGGRGGFGGGFGGPPGGGGRQLYVSNVCSPQCSPLVMLRFCCEPGSY